MLKKIACLVLSFIMCISLFCGVFALSVKCVLGDGRYWIKCADKLDLYASAEKSLELKMASFSIPSGIPESVFNELVTQEMIKEHFSEQFESASRGEIYSVDEEELKAYFVKGFEQYAIENGYEITDETNEGISGLADYCVDEYQGYVIMPIFTLLIRYIYDYTGEIIKLSVASFVIFAMSLTVLLVFMKKRSFGYISYSLSGTSLFCVLPFVLVYAFKVLNEFYFDPLYMYKLLVEVIKGYSVMLAFAALAVLFVGAGLAICDFVVSNKRKDTAAKEVKVKSEKPDINGI